MTDTSRAQAPAQPNAPPRTVEPVQPSATAAAPPPANPPTKAAVAQPVAPAPPPAKPPPPPADATQTAVPGAPKSPANGVDATQPGSQSAAPGAEGSARPADNAQPGNLEDDAAKADGAKEPGPAKGSGHIAELREILVKAAARDKELQQKLQELGAEIVKGLGCENQEPQWAELRANEKEKEKQEGPHFILQDKWLRGDLLVPVTPEQTFNVGLAVRAIKDGKHEATLNHERSQTVTIDPSDQKDRDEAHKKFVDRVFANLESQVRERVALPPE